MQNVHPPSYWCAICFSLAVYFPPLSARPYTFANLAGMPGTGGSSTGQGTAARFSYPFHVGADLQGNIYVADHHNHVIRRVSPSGHVSDWAGKAGSPGSIDATGDAARFNSPGGVAVAQDGTVYVADTGNHTIRKVSRAREVTTLAGTPLMSGSQDGTAGAALFLHPNAVTITQPGNTLFVADTYNHTIRKITPEGVVTTIAGEAGVPGSSDGEFRLGTTARFNTPTGLVYSNRDSALYIADFGNHTIRRLDPWFRATTTLAGQAGLAGVLDGYGGSARFHNPAGVAIDSDDTMLFVTDFGGHTIRRFPYRDPWVTTIGGSAGISGTASGTGTAARFNQPVGIAMTFDGMLVIGDATNNRLSLGVMRSEPGEFYWGGLAGWRYALGPEYADGWRGESRFFRPRGVATDSAGNVYVADEYGHVVRKITPAGMVTTVAGIPFSPGYEDSLGVENHSRLNQPTDVAVDATGHLYIADAENYTIRRLSPGGVMATLAGGVGQSGHVNGAGSAVRFGRIHGIAVGPDQHLVIADTTNHVIRKMTPAGEVRALAGLPGNPGVANGAGSTARFSRPMDVAVNGAGLCYVSDFDNRTVRAVTPAGFVSTLAGGGGSLDGPGAQARFLGPTGLAVDRDGMIYVADKTLIRRVTPSGSVSSLTRNGEGLDILLAYGPGHEAWFSSPLGIAVNAAGELTISDYFGGLLATGTPHGGRLQRSSNTTNIFFGAEPFRAYRLERSTNLGSNQWTTLATLSASFSGAVHYTDAAGPARGAYYRLRPQ